MHASPTDPRNTYLEDLTFKCRTCHSHGTGKKQGSYNVYLSADDFDSDYMSTVLVCCPRCDAPHVLTYRVWHPPDGAAIYSPSSIILPKGDDEERLDPSIPESVARNLLEARRVFSEAQGYVASALMCRRTIEAICHEFGAQGSSLFLMLKDLNDKGTIEQRLYEWADKILRILGNEAAHDVRNDISKDDAQDALDFTKAIVEYLYVFEAAYENFKKRRAKSP